MLGGLVCNIGWPWEFLRETAEAMGAVAMGEARTVQQGLDITADRNDGIR